MVALPYLWLLLFFVVPFVIVLKISFSDIDLAIPPYKPLIEWIGKNSLAIKVNFNNYAFLFTDSLYIHAFLNSIKVAFISTLLCLVIGYPMAYGIARSSARRRATSCCCSWSCRSGPRCCCASMPGSGC